MASSVDRCIASFDSLDGRVDSYCDKDYNFKFFKITVDPRSHFSEIVSESKEIPEAVRKAVVQKILEISKGHRIVLVELSGRCECQYPAGWHLSLMNDLFDHCLFVSPNMEYEDLSLYTRLSSLRNPLKKADVMRMTASRAL